MSEHELVKFQIRLSRTERDALKVLAAQTKQSMEGLLLVWIREAMRVQLSGQITKDIVEAGPNFLDDGYWKHRTEPEPLPPSQASLEVDRLMDSGEVEFGVGLASDMKEKAKGTSYCHASLIKDLERRLPGWSFRHEGQEHFKVYGPKFPYMGEITHARNHLFVPDCNCVFCGFVLEKAGLKVPEHNPDTIDQIQKLEDIQAQVEAMMKKIMAQ